MTETMFHVVYWTIGLIVALLLIPYLCEPGQSSDPLWLLVITIAALYPLILLYCIPMAYRDVCNRWTALRYWERERRKVARKEREM